MFHIILAIHVICAVATFTANTYYQLAIADNWPPTNYKKIAWDAVFTLFLLSLVAWPFLIFLMLLEHHQTKKFRKPRPFMTPAKALVWRHNCSDVLMPAGNTCCACGTPN